MLPYLKNLTLISLITFFIAHSVTAQGRLTITQNSTGYANAMFDAESGLYYLNARLYNPEIMRFIQWDTYGEMKKQNIFDARYNYGADNPVGNSDPSGHSDRPEDVINAFEKDVLGIKKESIGSELEQTMISNLEEYADLGKQNEEL